MLSGRSVHTIDNYQRNLMTLFKRQPDVDAWDLALVKEWMAAAPSDPVRRMRARAVKAFLRWATEEDVIEGADWYKRIKLPSVKELPQETATEADYVAAMTRAQTPRDRALLAVLWSSGMRRSEVARMRVEHLDLDTGCAIVPITKTGRFRTVPLSPEAVRLLRNYIRRQRLAAGGPLWVGHKGALGSAGVRGVLRRLNAPSAHCWRRGWTVSALASGVSQASVEAAAGWAGPAMVSRYTRQMAGDLALQEFGRRWAAG
jgi:integrase